MSSLISCRTCNNKVSRNANVCPNCGEPDFDKQKIHDQLLQKIKEEGLSSYVRILKNKKGKGFIVRDTSDRKIGFIKDHQILRENQIWSIVRLDSKNKKTFICSLNKLVLSDDCGEYKLKTNFTYSRSSEEPSIDDCGQERGPGTPAAFLAISFILIINGNTKATVRVISRSHEINYYNHDTQKEKETYTDYSVYELVLNMRQILMESSHYTNSIDLPFSDDIKQHNAATLKYLWSEIKDICILLDLPSHGIKQDIDKAFETIREQKKEIHRKQNEYKHVQHLKKVEKRKKRQRVDKYGFLVGNIINFLFK